MTAQTKNIFIEITATDHTRALASLACLTASFSQYCSTPFQIEQVKVVYENKVEVTPDTTKHSVSNDVQYCNKLLGINITTEEAVKLL